MYLLYLDESGTHVGSTAFVLAGLAVHEQDAWHFQQKLNNMLARRLPKGLRPADFELHATEIKNPIKVIRGKKVKSPWAQVSVNDRFGIIRATFRAIANYDCQGSARPCALFGAVVDGRYPAGSGALTRRFCTSSTRCSPGKGMREPHTSGGSSSTTAGSSSVTSSPGLSPGERLPAGLAF